MNISKKLVAGIAGAVLVVGAGGWYTGAFAGVPGSTDCKTLSYPLCSKSVAGSQVVNGSQNEIEMDAATRAKLQLGTPGPGLTVPETKIAKIGGPFATNATKLAEFTVPAGTWDIDAAVKFDRVDASAATYETPTTDTMPSFVLRFPGDAGTVMGAAISRAGYVELTGASHKRVKFTEPTKVIAYGFGYNEDRSGFGADQISVSAEVTTTRVG